MVCNQTLNEFFVLIIFFYYAVVILNGSCTIPCETWFKSSTLIKLNGFFNKLTTYEDVLHTGLRFLVLGNILDEFSVWVIAKTRNLISKMFTSYEHLKKMSCDRRPGVPLFSPVSCLWVRPDSSLSCWDWVLLHASLCHSHHEKTIRIKSLNGYFLHERNI